MDPRHLPKPMMRWFARRILPMALLASASAFAQLSIDPPHPTALDTVRLRYHPLAELRRNRSRTTSR